MSERTSNAVKLRVFISYSRHDFVITNALVLALLEKNFDIKIDNRDLPFGQKWQAELADFIRTSDTVIWLISPHSVRSEWVNWELDEVARHSKRLVPVMVGDAPRDKLPRQLGEVHILPAQGLFELSRDLDALVRVLETDHGWLKEASRLGERAHDWLVKDRKSALLLRGIALSSAERWRETRPAKAPVPEQATLELIIASKRAATSRQRWWIGGSLSLAVGAVILAGYAYVQSLTANEQRIRAIAERDTSLLTQSRFLSDLSLQTLKEGNAGSAVLLALEALPDGDDTLQQARPYWPGAEFALNTALNGLRERLLLNGHLGRVNSVAMTPDGTRIVTGSSDKTARLWDARTGATLVTLRNHEDSVTSVAITADGTRIITGSADHTARVWDAKTGNELMTLKGHEDAVTSVAVTPDGTLVVTGSLDKTARLWNPKTGAEMLAVKCRMQSITSVGIVRDGARIITACGDKTARLWDARTGTELFEFGNHLNQLHGVAVSPDGTRVVTTDAHVTLWDGESGAQLLRFTHGSPIISSAMTPDGTKIVTGSNDNTVRLWDARTGAELATLRGHTGQVNSIAITQEGTRVVTVSDDYSVRLWDIDDRSNSVVLKGRTGKLSGVGATPDGTGIITASDDNTVRLWDARTGAELVSIRPAGDSVTSVAVSADKTRIATGYLDGTLRIWNARNGAQLLELKGHKDKINSVALTPDGSRIVTGAGEIWGDTDNTARLWDGDTGTELLVLEGHVDSVTSVAVTPDVSHIVTGSYDKTARLWDGKTGVQLLSFVGHTEMIQSVAVTPDGTRIVTGALDGTVRLWDGKTGVQLLVLDDHVGGVTGVAVSSDGAHIVSVRGTRAGDDPVVRVWDAKTGAKLHQLEFYKEHEVVLSPSGANIVTIVPLSKHTREQGEDSAHLLSLNFGQSLVALAKRAASRCLTPAERQSRFLSQEPPRWCGIMQKWPYDSVGGIAHATALISDGGKEKEKEAEVIFRVLLQNDPGSAKAIDAAWALAYVRRGASLLGTSLEGDAEGFFMLAMKRDPAVSKAIDTAWAKAHIERGASTIRSGFENAEAEFVLAMKRDPGSGKAIEAARAKAQTQYGQSLLETGSAEEAELHFAQALKTNAVTVKQINEARAKGHMARAERLLSDGQDVAADAQFELARMREPSAVIIIADIRASSYNNRAWTAYEANNSETGLAFAEKAIALAPKDLNILDTRAHIYLSLDRIDEALRDFDKAIDGGIANPGSYFGRGRCKELKGNLVAAVDDYRVALNQRSLLGSGDELVYAKVRDRLAALGLPVSTKK